VFHETFSGGAHATTRLAAAALARVARPGTSVLDVGAGDGVLARVALAAGAWPVIAIDRRPAPGVRSISAERFLPGARFDVVVANLPDETLLALLAPLRAAAVRTLVVTGIRLWRGRTVLRALAGLELDPPAALDGWCCFVGTRRSS
jgi:ribosomal protein L11 methylase PrmA